MLAQLLQTEASYVTDLDRIVVEWFEPLRSLGTLPKVDVRALFSNCEILRGVNQELLRALLETKTPSGAAATFESFGPFLKAYSTYCADFMQATERLRSLAELRSREGWDSALEAVMQDAERKCGQSLGSLLIKPVQRLCKYPILLRELLKSLPPADPAAPDVARALGFVEATVHAVNERVREVEGRAALTKLASAIGQPELLAPSRFVLYVLPCLRRLRVACVRGGASPSRRLCAQCAVTRDASLRMASRLRSARACARPGSQSRLWVVSKARLRPRPPHALTRCTFAPICFC